MPVLQRVILTVLAVALAAIPPVVGDHRFFQSEREMQPRALS
ncbi:MAG: hypothetical protein QNK37_05245 [Acidobacteriota bacterium]|nr:hypothetical protein [Acidobacteriota bacterium]